MADDDDEVLDVLDASLALGAEEEAADLRKAWLAFDAEAPPPEDRSRLQEPAGADLRVACDAFEPDDDEYAQATYEHYAEARSMSLKGFLRRSALLGVMMSLADICTQWVYSINSADSFRLKLDNAWPLILFGGMLLGLCIEEMLSWLGHQIQNLWYRWQYSSLFIRRRAWRRSPKWQHTYCCCRRCKHNKHHLTRHFNHCCCMWCRFKRHWTYWKHFERYPKGWKRRT